MNNTNFPASEVVLDPSATVGLSASAASAATTTTALAETNTKIAKVASHSIKDQLSKLLHPTLLKELSSIVYEYSLLTEKEITELFLKLIFADQYVDESLAKECQDVAKFWLKEITHLNLSGVRVQAISRTTVVEPMLRGFFENVIQSYFPRLESIDLPTTIVRTSRDKGGSSFKIADLISINGSKIALKSYRKDDYSADYYCVAQFNKVGEISGEGLTKKTAQMLNIYNNKSEIFSASLKNPSYIKHALTDTVRTSLPRNVASIINDYAELTKKEISELFLKLLIVPFTKKDREAAHFWLHETSHLDLSKVKIQITDGTDSKQALRLLAEKIVYFLPNLYTLDPPLVYVNGAPLSITELNCPHLTIESTRKDDGDSSWDYELRLDKDQIEIIDISNPKPS